MRPVKLAISALLAMLALAWSPMAAAQATANPAQPAVVQPSVQPAPAPDAVPAGAQTKNTSLEQGYIIGIGDVLDVVMVGADDFRGRVTVQQDGTIQLPYVGSLTAQNKTLLELGKEVAAALEKGGYYVNPAIQVNVAQVSSRYVTVLGSVGNPGLIPVDRAYRASEMMARVGGIRADGASTFYLTREDGREIALTMEEIARGGDDVDPIVNPGDKIFVPVAPTYYIYGAVNSPGTFPIQKEMSLRVAIARSGGLSPLGSEKRITVMRNGEELKKFDLNDPILPDDIIIANERFF